MKLVERQLPEAAPSIAAFAPREKMRAMLRRRLPRRRGRIAFVRSADELAVQFRRTVVDLAIVDVSGAGTECERAVSLAREFPSAGFVAIAPYRTGDTPMLARCADLDFADLLAEGVDDALLAGPVVEHGFSARFARAHGSPPDELGVSDPFRLEVWRKVVALAGRPVRTAELAAASGVSREHLSRSFAREGAPNLKRIIDLIRLLSAADLAKNPGYDVADVARVLGYASGSHLSASTQRLLGTQASSLASLRAVDLIGRFVRGRGRSRV